MKANKAPEKIYVHIKDKPFEITFSEVIEKEYSNIEYIRKDAIIKKVEHYLNSQLYDWVSITTPNQRSCANVIPKIDFITRFKNYMKGK